MNGTDNDDDDDDDDFEIRNCTIFKRDQFAEIARVS